MQELEYMTSCQQFRHGIKDLTNAMKSHSINNRNGHQIWQPLSVISVLAGTYRAVSILTLLKARLQPCYLQVRLFRVSKKTNISGVPASPIADSVLRRERIKTDYNSYLCTWRSLIVIYFNNLCEIA